MLEDWFYYCSTKYTLIYAFRSGFCPNVFSLGIDAMTLVSLSLVPLLGMIFTRDPEKFKTLKLPWLSFAMLDHQSVSVSINGWWCETPRPHGLGLVVVLSSITPWSPLSPVKGRYTGKRKEMTDLGQDEDWNAGKWNMRNLSSALMGIRFHSERH